MAKKLYKFNKYFGRAGHLEGIFIAEESDVDKLIKEETNIYFGEVLGKHSSVSCIIKAKDITKLNVYESTISDLLLEIGNTISGYNPLDYLEDDDKEEE